MSELIENYAFLSDCRTGALVSKQGSIDWLCVPRFDSEACFAALLGGPKNGRWVLTPKTPPREIQRRYRGDTLILETTFTTDEGEVLLVDFMDPELKGTSLFRLVVGRRGTVRMKMDLVIRFDYGQLVPWVRQAEGRLCAIAGPQSLHVETSVKVTGEDLRTVAEFDVAEGQRVPLVLTCYPSHEPPPPRVDAEEALRRTDAWWTQWAGRCNYDGPWRDAVVRSLITLKGLTYAPTGGMVAALTTSLPEQIGGSRNWDYRCCWIRDATFVLYALTTAGYTEEAAAWRDWVHRAIAGSPSQIQTVYGIAGERRLDEYEIGWLPGYENSRPVRVGNGAYRQLQLDCFGEIMDAMHLARRAGLHPDPSAWNMQRKLIEHLESIWRNPDKSIWEVRGPDRQFTYSKVLIWVALDRAVKALERFGLTGSRDRWRALRRTVHDEVCSRGFNPDVGAFVQSYGSKELDASLLIIPLVGFLPITDPRVQSTVERIQSDLRHDGFVLRYASESGVDGLPAGEGAFLLCSFWLADNLAMMGRMEEAEALFERLVGLANDVGLLPEQYDSHRGRFLGNFPQAFSHVALINTAYNLLPGFAERRPSSHRSQS